MSLLFWRKRGSDDNEVSQVARIEDPLPVQLRRAEDSDPLYPVAIEQDYLPPVAGQQITRLVQVPGIGTGAAYADGEAFGGLITFPDLFRAEKKSGTIVKIVFYDLDDEGLQKDVPLFDRTITATTDNNAFAPTDADLLACLGVVSITNFYNWNVNQIGQATNLGLWVKSTDQNLYTQLVTRGADNIAAGALPWIAITVVPD